MRSAALLMALGMLALAVPAAAAATGDMSVAAFLAKADALRAKGIMALGSSDIGLLRSEGQAAGQAYKARLEAERKDGRPSSCPPKGTKVQSDKLMAFMRTYPEPARPRTTMKTAIADYFIKTWPCG